MNEEEIIKEFENHPALKFANENIVFNAVRMGGTGYTGEENLTEWLRKTLSTYRKGIEEELAEKIRQMKPNTLPLGDLTTNYTSYFIYGYNQALIDTIALLTHPNPK